MIKPLLLKSSARLMNTILSAAADGTSDYVSIKAAEVQLDGRRNRHERDSSRGRDTQ
ncbi:MAG: hypothetical protein NVS1B4_26710 [Gemmatimonadaceae bacterium]